MKLPFLISLPHAGRIIPPEVERICILSEHEILRDGDEGAAEIYTPLRGHVAGFVTTDVARAAVDLNRAPDDRRRDGVVKTHTCWDVPIYNRAPTEKVMERLLEKYYHPFHARLSREAEGKLLGFDCHTMAAKGPPVGPDPGSERPAVCLSNADGTCPDRWIRELAECFHDHFKLPISINGPFKGGFIIRTHAKELPWIQVELSRAPFMSNYQKSIRIKAALLQWFVNHV